MIILSLMALTTLGIIKLRNLFSVVILSTIYSFLMATLLLIFDAVDVALTEAAVGAGISTVLMLTVLYYTKVSEEMRKFKSILPLISQFASEVLIRVSGFGMSSMSEKAEFVKSISHFSYNNTNPSGRDSMAVKIFEFGTWFSLTTFKFSCLQ